MAKKQVHINIETNEKLDKLVSTCEKVFNLSENDIYKLFIKTGFQNNALSFNDALFKGAEIQKEFLEHAKMLLKLNNVTKQKIEPANVVEQNLMPLVDKLKDDELIQQIKRGEL